MPSFDIVSETDVHEAENAVGNLMREIGTRYDFKGSNAKVLIEGDVVTIHADNEMKLRQIRELLQGSMQKRGIAPGALDYRPQEKAAGQAVRQQVVLRQGIDRDVSSTIIKALKAEKFRVQVAVRGDALRVSGKKRDELRQVIDFIREMKINLPLQYRNFRD